MTRQPSSPPDAWQLALRLLTRRDYGSAELAARLRRRGCHAEAIETAIERLQELGYLDDRRHAERLARQLVSAAKAWGARLRQELKQRGLDDNLVNEAAAEAEAQTDPVLLVRDTTRRRYPGLDYNTATDKERRRVVHFFQRRGFPLDLILTALRHSD